MRRTAQWQPERLLRRADGVHVRAGASGCAYVSPGSKPRPARPGRYSPTDRPRRPARPCCLVGSRRVSQSSVAELVGAAVEGDVPAWEDLVGRFAGLVWGIARSHRLGDADAADVSQTVWLRLVEHLPGLREPAAIGGWLATTTRHESLRVLRRSGREMPADDLPVLSDSPDNDPTPEEVAVRQESNAALWQALDTLSLRCRTLLRALATWPDANYAQVSEALDMPIGSIGPTRARCLVHLRRAMAEQSSPHDRDGW